MRINFLNKSTNLSQHNLPLNTGKLALTSAILTAIMPTMAFADAIAPIETIVVTANRTEQLNIDVLSSVTVLTRDDIELAPSSSVAEVLAKVNGLQISQNGGAGQNTSLFSRGTNSGHTLVVIDGQRISSATLGATEFSHLSLAQIEHIEVIKGPRAALWGADAVGGVIQIFTRQLNPNEVAVDLSLGNYGQKQITASTAVGHGHGATTFTLGAQSQDGYDVLIAAEPDDDGFERNNFSLNGYQKLSDAWQLGWLGKYDDGKSEYDNAYGGANRNSFVNKQWQLSAKQSVENFSQDVLVGYQNNEARTYGNGIAEKDGSLFETSRVQFSWLAHSEFNDYLSGSVGVDYIDEEINATTDYEQDQRDNYALFTRLAYDNEGVLVDLALRYDDIENVGHETTYNFSIGQRFDNTLISLNLGSSFKAPSFNDLYYPADPYSYGNPDLTFETGDTIELLLSTSVADIDAEISIYNSKIDNLIEWASDEDFRYTPSNVNKVEINGIEVTLSAQALGLSHQVQVGYLDAINDETKERLIRRAKNTASYQVTGNWRALTFATSVNYRGRRQDSQWPGFITLPSHTLVDLTLSYELTNALNVSLKANNLLDKSYQTSNGYRGQPEQYLLTLSYRQ